MTIIDELLILLDDLGETVPERIPTFFPEHNLQVVFSSLGRLVNRGWVAKRQRRQQTTYALTIHGINELNRTLDAIKTSDDPEWDRQWRLVIFDIPESKRKMRDQFRNFLREQGFGQLKSSVWLSPWDKSESVRPVIKRLNLGDIVTLFTTMPAADTYQSIQLAQQCWNWSGLEKRYKEFLERTDKELSRIKSANDEQRFMAKRLVFHYAEVVKDDPRLPTGISPIASLARRAHECYIKIRPYCLPIEAR